MFRNYWNTCFQLSSFNFNISSVLLGIFKQELLQYCLIRRYTRNIINKMRWCLFSNCNTYLAIKLVLPANSAPTGHPNPLLKQKQTVSTSRATLFGVTRKYTAAFIILAPSICTAMLCSAAILLTFSNHSRGNT